MSEKILFVDDDPNLLASLERRFRRDFPLETAAGGEAGLARIAENGGYAVVVADRQMPVMDGIRFLTLVKERAPDTIRLMLTGNADLDHAVRVVNEGNIFRFLTKPCPPEVLSKALRDAQEQYRLVTAEKELLNKTLNGSVKLLMDILSMLDSQAVGRSQVLRDVLTGITDKLKISNAWEIHLAVMLAPIGYVTIPPETLLRLSTGEKLSEVEAQTVFRLPETAARLLANIPRLEGVAKIVHYQHKSFDGSGFPADGIAGESIPLGARLLRILADMMLFQKEGRNRLQALDEMELREGAYDPALLAAVRRCEAEPGPAVAARHLTASVKVENLIPGMVLRSNVETKDGTLILSVGHQLTDVTLEKIRNFERISGIREPILIEAIDV